MGEPSPAIPQGGRPLPQERLVRRRASQRRQPVSRDGRPLRQRAGIGDEAIKPYRWIVAEYPAAASARRHSSPSMSSAAIRPRKTRRAEAAKAYLAAYPTRPTCRGSSRCVEEAGPRESGEPSRASPAGHVRSLRPALMGRRQLDPRRPRSRQDGRAPSRPARSTTRTGSSWASPGRGLHPNLADRDLKRDAGLLVGTGSCRRRPRTSISSSTSPTSTRTRSSISQNPLRLVIDAQAAATAPPRVASIPTPAPTIAPAPPPPPPLPEPVQPPEESIGGGPAAAAPVTAAVTRRCPSRRLMPARNGAHVGGSASRCPLLAEAGPGGAACPGAGCRRRSSQAPRSSQEAGGAEARDQADAGSDPGSDTRAHARAGC